MRIASRLAITVGLALGAIAIGAGSAGAATFSNTTPIVIPSSGNATPYPSQITVSGQTAPITDLNVNLNGFGHTFPLDTAVVLVGPGGQALLLMSCVGGNTPVTNVNLKIDDSAATQLPPNGPLASGSFKPANHCGNLPSFPAPGPLTAYGNPGPIPDGTATLASTFFGTSANGTWNLYVRDGGTGFSGVFAGGWSLEVSPDPPPPVAKKKCKKGQKLKKGKCVKKKRKKKK